ncbi:Cyclin N-terminal domain-containing protein [Mycena venus]|uniref:Cyclin N-terminal domain-containing protein n=1 Tax=Mycena venus TaxID=2733690 RepID=A0A8H7CKM9_9AGAR|nr:Cyclin N-terminal domain-containing protein [Mycena venus]
MLFDFASPASSSSSSSSPSSRASSPVHAASLVDPATHAPALMQLIDIKLDRHVIDYVVDCVSETVDYAMGRSAPPAPSPLLSRAEVTPATLLVSLVYIHRARPHLSIALEEWALERVFLGALIVASKYTNDSTLKNVHWALCTGVFGKRDVGRIEREFLDVLDWELGVQGGGPARPPRGARRRPGARTQLLAPPHRRTHSRKTSVPELEPSSPQSSLASMSPRTPSSYPHSPAHHRPAHSATYHQHAAYHRSAHRPQRSVDSVDVPMDVDPVSAPPKAGKWNDLLRAFPLPRHGTRTRAWGADTGECVGAYPGTTQLDSPPPQPRPPACPASNCEGPRTAAAAAPPDDSLSGLYLVLSSDIQNKTEAVVHGPSSPTLPHSLPNSISIAIHSQSIRHSAFYTKSSGTYIYSLHYNTPLRYHYAFDE